MSLADLLKAKKASLKPTETVVRPMPVCCTGTEEEGLSALGGEVEPERTEDESVTVEAAAECARALQASQHAVVYTGAGVSTSTGIGDYRGPNGVWTSLATGRIPDDSFDYTGAIPSYTHMSIAKLVEVGLLKSCMSTNLDGLHYKSGLEPLKNLSEVHGNKFVERCPDCQNEILRPFPIRRTSSRATGRRCVCGGAFMDSGIDFGQNLPTRHLDLAEREAEASDFSLVLGTSMRVRPASEIPLMGKRVAAHGPRGTSRAQLCIVNRMDTPFDERARIRSYGDTDVFFLHLMQHLGLDVPEPPDTSHLKTSAQMRRLATPLLPPTDGHFVGEEELIERVAAALTQVEEQLLNDGQQ